MTKQDWERAGRFVSARRQRLGIKQSESKVSAATWSKIENGRQDGYKPFTLSALEAELRLPPGTILDVAAGGTPPVDDDEDLRDRVGVLEAQVAEVLRLLRQLPGTSPDDAG